MAIPGWSDNINPSWVNMKLSGGQPMDNPTFKSNYEKYKYLGQKDNGNYVFFNGDNELSAAQSQKYQITNLEEHRNKIADATKKNEMQLEINKAIEARDKVWQESVDKLNNSDLQPRIRQVQQGSGSRRRGALSDSQGQFNSLLSIKNLLGE